MNENPWNLPAKSDLDLTEIRSTLPANLLSDPRTQAYEKYVPLTTDHVQPSKDLQFDGFRPEMIRVLPNALPILDEEIKWIMPFSMDEVMWDHEEFD